MSETRFIFLDIDGVLNSARAVIGFHNLHGKAYDYYREKGGRMKPDDDGVIFHFKTEIESTALGILKDFTEMSGAKIVISSSWRKLYDLPDFVAGFAWHGWENAPIIDRTPAIYEIGSKRGDEVAAWLKKYSDEHPDEEISYVIFDDDRDFHPDQPLIWVTHDNGLGMHHLAQACKHFGIVNKYVGYVYDIQPDPSWARKFEADA